MGLRSIDLSVAIGGPTNVGSTPMTRGALVQASISYITQGTTQQKAPWATLALHRSTSATQTRIETLTQGYLTEHQTLDWDGQVPIDEDTQLVLAVNAYAGDKFRATAYTLDIATAEKGFPRDP